MNLLDKDTEQLISDYVANRLSDEELEQFELELFENAELVVKVEAAQLLHAGLLTSDENQSFSDQNVVTKEHSSLFGSLMTRDVPRYLVLALLLLPIGMSFINFGKQQESFVSGAPNLIRFNSEATRGASQPLELDLVALPTNSFLLLKVSSKLFPSYRLKLRSVISGEVIWTSKEVKLSALGDILFSLPQLSNGGKVIVSVHGVDVQGREITVEFCSYDSDC